MENDWGMVYNGGMAIPKEVKESSRILKIFANEDRLAILNFLKSKGEKSVGQIADSLEIPFNTASKNLLFLNNKGILERRYDGPFVLYKISKNISKLATAIFESIQSIQ